MRGVVKKLVTQMKMYPIINDASLIVDKYHTSENGSDITISCFLSNFWGLATLKKINTETRVFCTKFGIVKFISDKCA